MTNPIKITDVKENGERTTTWECYNCHTSFASKEVCEQCCGYTPIEGGLK